MHPKVLALSRHFGVPIKERGCVFHHVFDGKSIATHGSKGEFTDHDLLHEIAHFVVAAPEQRDLPEYGLGYAAIAGELPTVCVVYDYDGPHTPYTYTRDNEGTIQEMMVQLLCIKWGMAYDINPKLSEDKGKDNPLTQNWETYHQKKIFDSIENFEEGWIECNWEALIRLSKLGLLDHLPIP